MMNLELMNRVYRMSDVLPPVALPSGHTDTLLAQVDNLSLSIAESQSLVELPPPANLAEEFVYVLNGQLRYPDGRTAGAGEAVYNRPDVTHPGSYQGQLLIIRVVPESDTLSGDSKLMNTVFRYQDVTAFYEAKVMTTRRLWVATDNFSIVMNESEPGSSFKGVIHPEKEIVYVIRGQLEYDNGRVVRGGEAVINLPNEPHPGRRGGTEHIRSFEAKAPADPKLLEMARSSHD